LATLYIGVDSHARKQTFSYLELTVFFRMLGEGYRWKKQKSAKSVWTN